MMDDFVQVWQVWVSDTVLVQVLVVFLVLFLVLLFLLLLVHVLVIAPHFVLAQLLIFFLPLGLGQF